MDSSRDMSPGSSVSGYETARTSSSYATAHSHVTASLVESHSATNSPEPRAASPSPEPVANFQGTFLFVVNEIKPNLGSRWGARYAPPKTATAYGPEKVGRVFRFHDGTVTEAIEYHWERPAPGKPGRIVRHSWAEPGCVATRDYKTVTVFECEQSQRACFFTGSDVTVVRDHLPERQFWPLAFRLGDDEVARVARGGVQVAAGSWVGPLARPAYYSQNALASRGLGGDIAVVLGLMALASFPGFGDARFAFGHWCDYQWRGGIMMHSVGMPRGFVAHVAVEIDGDLFKNLEWLADLEEYGVAVVG